MSPGNVAREGIPFELFRSTNVSPATSRPGYPGFVAGEYGKCCSDCLRLYSNSQRKLILLKIALSSRLKHKARLYYDKWAGIREVLSHRTPITLSSYGGTKSIHSNSKVRMSDHFIPRSTAVLYDDDKNV
ncbi:hypothetical protein Tco_0688300 [Tanacetum coccineum]